MNYYQLKHVFFRKCEEMTGHLLYKCHISKEVWSQFLSTNVDVLCDDRIGGVFKTTGCGLSKCGQVGGDCLVDL